MSRYANYIYVDSPVDLQARTDLAAVLYRDLARNLDSRVITTDTQTTASSGDDVLDALVQKANETYTVVISATGGTFNLDYDGTETAAIAYNATPAAVEAALAAIPALVDAVVVGGAAGSYVVQFVGTLSWWGDTAPATLADGASTALTGGGSTNTVTQVIVVGTQQA